MLRRCLSSSLQSSPKALNHISCSFGANVSLNISGWTLRRAMQFSAHQFYMTHKEFTGGSPRNMCPWSDQSIPLGCYLWGLVTATISVELLFPHESYWFFAFRSTCGAKTWRMRGGRWAGGRGGNLSSSVSLAGIKELGCETPQWDHVFETKDFWCVQSEGLGTVVFVVSRRMEPVFSFRFKEMKPSASEASRSEGRL